MTNYVAKLSAARLAATKAAPYYSHALLSLIPIVVSTGTLTEDGTLAVTEDYVMLAEEGALDRWTVKEIGAVLLHEVSHVLRFHFRRVGNRNKKLANLCEDMEINDDIRQMGLPLPDKGGVQPGMFELPDSKPFEWYYEQLEPKMKKAAAALQKMLDDAGVGGGKCGGCAGNPHDKEQDAVPEGTPRRTKAETQQISAAVAHQVKEHIESQKQGTVPLGVRRWADLHGTPPEVSWQEQLTRACRRAVTYRPGAIDYRYNRPSRRQAGIGFGPGRAVLPTLIHPVPQVAIMFDTSGSMDGKLLTSAARETDGVLKAISARVRFCVVDAKVHALQDVQTIDQALRLLKGGGGTDFNDAFRQLEASKPPPEVIVVMTDGYASVPSKAPRARVVWCLIGGNSKAPAAYGDVVKVT